jgi:anti-sigma factor RsiW
MNQNDDTPDRTPTPEQIAAWVDGETSRCEADFVEAWVADHPEARRDAESMAQLTRLYRDQPIPTPSEARWRSALDRIVPRVAPTPEAARRWRAWLGVALASAALVGAVILARNLWPAPTPAPIAQVPQVPDEEDEEPFAVASSSEVHIIRMDAEDADRVVTGRPLLGTMDFAGPGDIDVLQVQPDPDEGRTPRLERRAGLSWVVLAKADEEDEP